MAQLLKWGQFEMGPVWNGASVNWGQFEMDSIFKLDSLLKQ